MSLIQCSECTREISDKAFACPHCGAPTSVAAVDRATVKDQVFFNERGVQVTNARFIIPGNRTFAMSGVTAVRMNSTKPSRKAPFILILAGIVIVACMVAGDGPVAVSSLVIPAAIIALGAVWISQIRPTFYVVLSTASGETQELKDRSADWISRVVEALNRCIVYRG